LAKKEYIGLTYEENRLRMARVKVLKNSLELIEVNTFDLPHPVANITDSGFGELDFSEDYEEIFDMDSSTSSESSSGFDDFDESESSGEKSSKTTQLEDSFDMTKTEDEADIETDNEQILAEFLTQYGAKKLRIGTHIPFGRTTFQILKNVDPGSMKKSEREDFFKDKLQTTTNEVIDKDQYAWEKIDDKNCLLAYSADERNFLNLIEVSETYLNNKLLVYERLPDEAIWAGLARVNYQLAPDDITGLIAIGPSSSRIIFMKGENIVNVLPIITEGENSNVVLNTIFSKILFEIDKGDLPKITRLLLVRSARLSEKAKQYFAKQFENVEIDFLKPTSKNLSYSDEILDSPTYLQPYLTAIGAAWGASKIHEEKFSNLSLLPEYVREKHRVLKLEWHGIVILVLIALTPLFLNYLYQSKSSELNSVQQELQVVNNQIDEVRPLATMTEDLMSDITQIDAENELLLELAQYSQRWSQTFQILNNGVDDIPGVWLSSLSTSDNNTISFEGFSLNRSSIPEFATLFTDANILQVTETEIRERTIYSFGLSVNNLEQDLDPFLLEMPERDFDAEQGAEVEINFSSNEQLGDNPPEEMGSSQNESSINNNSSSENQNIASNDVETELEPNGNGLESSGSNDASANNDIGDSIEVPPIVSSTNQSSYGLMGPEDHLLEGAYTIVLHSITDNERANQEVETLKREGFKATLWDVVLEDNRTRWRIGVGQFRTVSSALQAVQKLPDTYKEKNFIIRIREGQ
jgi:hypothetical protein